MNGADTAWIIVATALVLFMTLPGLALFYGGLVRARNVLSVFMHCYAIACLMSVLWFALGYSIAFGGGDSGLWGGLDKVLLLGLSADDLAGTLPEVLFFAFQMTFAIITPALIVGAYVERVGFGFVLLFSALWMLLVYAPVVHWIWGGGMLSDGGIFGETGVRDFAGGIVVHETAGLAALLLAVFLGPRRNKTTPPHNPGFVMIGAAMLWVGWFGFNGGSQLAMGTVGDVSDVSRIFANTNMAAAAGAVTALILTQVMYKKPDLTMVLNGALAGLVSITAEPLAPTLFGALWIGAVGGVIVVLTVPMLDKLKIDDVVGAVPVHLFAGIWGTIAVIFYNGDANLITQLTGIVAYGVFTFVASLIVWFILKAVMGIRVGEEEEIAGLDMSELGMEAYPEFSKG